MVYFFFPFFRSRNGSVHTFTFPKNKRLLFDDPQPPAISSYNAIAVSDTPESAVRPAAAFALWCPSRTASVELSPDTTRRKFHLRLDLLPRYELSLSYNVSGRFYRLTETNFCDVLIAKPGAIAWQTGRAAWLKLTSAATAAAAMVSALIAPLNVRPTGRHQWTLMQTLSQTYFWNRCLLLDYNTQRIAIPQALHAPAWHSHF